MHRIYYLILLLAASPALFATQIELGGGIEYFQWEEFADGGNKLLSETGPRYFIGIKGTNRVDQRWSLDFLGRVYSGTVNYDGQTMGGTPITTDTDYNGVRSEIGLSYLTRRNKSEPHRGDLLVRFSLGIDSWRRGLLDTTTSGGTPVSGYTERYYVAYGTVEAQYLGGGWRAGVGVLAPYYVDETVSIISDYPLHPEGQLSPFANLEFNLSAQWSLAMEYRTYRFAKSDVNGGYYQPKSTQDTLSASLRYHF